MDDSGITQEDFDKLLASKSETTDEPDEDESTEDDSSTDAETEESEATEAEDEEDDSEDPSQEAEIDWDKVDPRVRQAYETAAKEQKRWQEGYSKIQSRFTKASQAQKQQETSFQTFKERAELLDRFENFLDSNPAARQALEREMQQKASPQGDIPDYLQKDPAFEYIQKNLLPYVQRLEKQVQEFGGKTQYIDQMRAQESEQKARNELDGHLETAASEIKNALGRDPTKDEMFDVLEFMVEKKLYDGEYAAQKIFKDQFAQAKQEKYQNEMREKSKKLGTRTKTVNSRLAKDKAGHMNLDEAVAAALLEQGVE